MEWTAYLRIGFIVAVYLLGPFFIIWLYKRYKALSKVGTIVLAYALGIILSLSGIMDDAWAGDAVLVSWQSTLQTLCVPLAIPLMLFSADFKTWTRSLKKTFVAFGLHLVQRLRYSGIGQGGRLDDGFLYGRHA